MSAVLAWLRRDLWDIAPRDHHESPDALHRRQVVTLVVLVLGGIVLGFSLRIEPGNRLFYLATAGLAVVWAVGALASGPLHLGRTQRGDDLRRPILAPLVIAALLVLLFAVGALLIDHLDFLDFVADPIRSVLHQTDGRSKFVLLAITAVNGIAEEMFFRGAAYAAVTRHPVAVTTVGYTLATLASGNVMLTFAAVILGSVVGLQRRASGGLLAPIITHITWTGSMLFLLPAVFL